MAKTTKDAPKEEVKAEKTSTKTEVKPAKEPKPVKEISKAANKPESKIEKKEKKVKTETKDKAAAVVAKPEKVKSEKIKVIKPKEQPAFYFKAFGRWDTKDIVVQDPGLKRYISLRPVLVPFTAGRLTEKQFWKSKKPIIERLANRIMVPGHKRKKHFRTSGPISGKKHIAYKIVKETFEIIEKRTKKNPIEVFVKAIETGAPREGITTIEYGGVAYPKAVDMSPQKRIDLVLRWFTQSAYHSAASSKSKNPVAKALAEEIIATYNNDNKATVISRKIEVERQAQSSR